MCISFTSTNHFLQTPSKVQYTISFMSKICLENRMRLMEFKSELVYSPNLILITVILSNMY